MPSAHMFPEPPSSSIDWSSIGSDAAELTSHVESTYSSVTQSWSAPTVVDSPYLHINGFAAGLNHGGPYYETLTARRTRDDRILLFRPLEHAHRLADAAASRGMVPVPESHFLACVKKVVAVNTSYVPPHHIDAVLFLRPLLFGPGTPRIRDSPAEYTFYVFARPGMVYPRTAAQNAIVLTDSDHEGICAPINTPRNGGGGIWEGKWQWDADTTPLPNRPWAPREGYSMVLRLDSARPPLIDRFSTSAFLGVREDKGKYTLVVPRHPSASILSDTCVAIAPRLGWKVEIGPIPIDEIDTLSEVIATSAVHWLLPVRLVFRPSARQTVVYQSGSHEAGPACQVLRNAIGNLMGGRVADPWRWGVPVTRRDWVA
ncbi:branched-chain amino acid aminotransferase [Aspergillus sclerotiicarbonarius CBS 121057]|uniref:Branched-chain amino acid aminotransferase n=1 Tax=Aspergillus sclerotiicarbonarius (strain CBS 121057 / IBT 28362) TaxID=1448318 RepID=A0A319F7V6_ASPSB|nr:branched-chain amino acid aminotransferase [Aspergillus sclerotiicarbonarius CBS 121057]